MAPVNHDDDEDDEPKPDRSPWMICPRCDGEGKTSLYLGAYTSSEWAEQDDDFKEDYMAGAYDRACEACGGAGKIREKAYEDFLERWDEMRTAARESGDREDWF